MCAGKRGRAMSFLDENNTMYLFGGFRPWHGYADENSKENLYNQYTETTQVLLSTSFCD